jgi:DNA-directed RNA polymerase beta' subunit
VVTVDRLCAKALRFGDAPLAAKLVPVSVTRLRERAPKAVVKPETLNFSTMLPEAGGLFDPRVFGAGTVIDAPLPDPDEIVKPRKTLFARIPLAIPVVNPLAVANAAEETAALIGRDSLARSTGVSLLDHARELVAALTASDALHGLVLVELPVLPPDLRALLRDDEDRWTTTPLNRWYQRILYCNARLAKHLQKGQDSVFSLANEYGELVSLVGRLFHNDLLPDPERDPDGNALPSLRTLCGGAAGLETVVRTLAGPAPFGADQSGSAYVARAVLFGLGFEAA